VTDCRPSEQLLIDALGRVEGDRVLCTSLGRGQLAAALAGSEPARRVVCHFLDAYRAGRAREHCGDSSDQLTIVCQSDLPGGEVDLVAFPFSAQGEGELTRELMQQGHLALRLGGRMCVASDNPRDTWLGQQMWALFAAVSRRPAPQGVVYEATKTAPLAKRRDFTCELVFRDGPRLIHAVSRPGVFAHRRVDAGARAILRTMAVGPGARVCDMGCGAGVLALAAALRADGVTVHAVDSNPRAIACTQRGAELNGLTTTITAQLDAEGNCPAEDFDLFLANPPYYSDFRIAEIFVRAAQRGLRPGGRLLLVTKSADWYARNMSRWFSEVEIRHQRDYLIVSAVQGPA
jgi:16S rRNA (guanine1207-N2)-methyltransferase